MAGVLAGPAKQNCDLCGGGQDSVENTHLCVEMCEVASCAKVASSIGAPVAAEKRWTLRHDWGEGGEHEKAEQMLSRFMLAWVIIECSGIARVRRQSVEIGCKVNR